VKAHPASSIAISRASPILFAGHSSHPRRVPVPSRKVAPADVDVPVLAQLAPAQLPLNDAPPPSGNGGWTNPGLVDEQGVLIAGYGRVAAAPRLGLNQFR
jgi:hypothetical protein